MKERPILMSSPMVRALLAGTKTQTRRVVKPLPITYSASLDSLVVDDAAMLDGRIMKLNRYGQPGDRLWVREAWRAVWSSDDEPPRSFDAAHRFWYEADAPLHDGYGKLRPSIHMPRCASRITLEVTEVHVERLGEISEADALAEGIVPTGGGFGLPDGSHFHGTDPRVSYWSLWESINGPGSVEANPWVWVLEFSRVKAA